MSVPVEDEVLECTDSSKIKFIRPDDKVVSEVNPFLVSSLDNKNVGLHQTGQKSTHALAKISFTLPKSVISLLRNYRPLSNSDQENVNIVQDNDGDLVLSRDPNLVNDSEELHIFIEYENATTLDLVGLQIWRGAFLLSDFVIHFVQDYFQGKKVLELGAGTGLVGIVASLFAEKVVMTDLKEPSIQDLLKANISHNKKLLIEAEKYVRVLPLDFMDLNWSPELLEAASTSHVVLAADVIYHVDITTAFVRTLKKLLMCSTRPKDIFIALEKRYIFTFSDLESVAPMHNHFLEEMDLQLNICPGALPKPLLEETGKMSSMEISMSLVPLDFKQYFNYEKCKELVLYHVKLRKITHN